MSKFNISTMLLLALVVAAFSQPNFSGKWKLDTEKTVVPDRGPGRMAKSLTVTQGDNKLTVDRVSTNRDGDEVTNTENYTLDGKKCVNEMRFGDRESTVQVKDNTIVITSVTKFEREGNTFEMNGTETWKLDNNGKELVIDSHMETPRGDRDLTIYYSKVQ